MGVLESLLTDTGRKRRDLIERLNGLVAAFMVKASATQPDSFGTDADFDQRVLEWVANVRDVFSENTFDKVNAEVGEWFAYHKFPPGGAGDFRRCVDRAKRAMRVATNRYWFLALAIVSVLGITGGVVSMSRFGEGCSPRAAVSPTTTGPILVSSPRPTSTLTSPIGGAGPVLSTPPRPPCDLRGVADGIHDIVFPTGVDVLIHIVKPARTHGIYFDGHFSVRPKISHGWTWDENDPRHGSFNARGSDIATEAYASFTTDGPTTLSLGFWGLDAGQTGPSPVAPQSQLRIGGRDSFRSVWVIGTAGDLPGSMSISWDCAR